MFKVGIIGYGKFGSFLSDILREKLHIRAQIYSPSRSPDQKQFFSLDDLTRQNNLIILAVSINKFANLIKDIDRLDYINKQTVIMDTCSVKEYPVGIMTKYLSKKFSLVASHPMFGPGTYSKIKSLDGFNMMISNINTDLNLFEKVKAVFSQGLKLNLVEMTPIEHDVLVAKSQFFAQTVRYLQNRLGYKSTVIDTESVKRLLDTLSMIKSNEDLYLDMSTYNKYARIELEKIVILLKEFVV